MGRIDKKYMCNGEKRLRRKKEQEEREKEEERKKRRRKKIISKSVINKDRGSFKGDSKLKGGSAWGISC